MGFIFISNEGTDSIKFGMKPEEISKILGQNGKQVGKLRDDSKAESFNSFGLIIFYKKNKQNG